MTLFITFLNTLGVRLGKLIQNIFTSAKTLSLVGLIFLGIFVGRNAGAMIENFGHFWAVRNAQAIEPGANFLKSLIPAVTAGSGALGLFVAFGVAQVLQHAPGMDSRVGRSRTAGRTTAGFSICHSSQP